MYDPLSGAEKGNPNFNNTFNNRGIRDYDVVLVLPNKIEGKKYKFNDPEDNCKGLKDPPAADKARMENWQAKRNMMIKSMVNAELNLAAFYSHNREEVVIKIGVEVDKLKELAEQKRHLIQMKDEYLSAYAEYRRDYQDEDGQRHVFEHLYREGDDENHGPAGMFRTVDRIQLIDYCLRSHSKGCCGIDIGHLTTSGDIKSYFPLHERDAKESVINAFKHHFIWGFIFANEINKVRDYFGEKVAFYFLWMNQLTLYLGILGAIGIVVFILDIIEATPDNLIAVPFALFICMWNANFVHLWRRESATFSQQWGTLNLKEEFEESRPDFYGEKRINPVTERVDFYYPWSKRIWSVLRSFGVIACAMACLVFVVLALFTLRHTMHGMGHPAMPFIFMLINALIVELLNNSIDSLAIFLTQQENHRTDREYETFLMAKTVIFKFFNSYISLYYIAFFKYHADLFGIDMKCLHDDCMVDLEAQLAVFVFFRLIFANAAEIFWPKIVRLWRRLRAQMGHLSLKDRIDFLMHDSSPDISIAEMQRNMNEYDAVDDLDEMVVNYGYTVLFTTACPWVPMVMIIANIFEIWVDGGKILKDMRRPFPHRVRNQEPWDSVFDIISIMGIFTNLALVCFASKELESWGSYDRLILFLVLEHLIFGSRMVVKSLLPEIPTEILVLDMKHNHIVRKYLDGVEQEDHDLKHHVHRNREMREEFDIMDHDDDEYE